jgi:hypothetical protein
MKHHQTLDDLQGVFSHWHVLMRVVIDNAKDLLAFFQITSWSEEELHHSTWWAFVVRLGRGSVVEVTLVGRVQLRVLGKCAKIQNDCETIVEYIFGLMKSIAGEHVGGSILRTAMERQLICKFDDRPDHDWGSFHHSCPCLL